MALEVDTGISGGQAKVEGGGQVVDLTQNINVRYLPHSHRYSLTFPLLESANPTDQARPISEATEDEAFREPDEFADIKVPKLKVAQLSTLETEVTCTIEVRAEGF